MNGARMSHHSTHSTREKRTWPSPTTFGSGGTSTGQHAFPPPPQSPAAAAAGSRSGGGGREGSGGRDGRITRAAWRQDMPGTAKYPGGTDRRARSTSGRQDVLGRQYGHSGRGKVRGNVRPYPNPSVILEASRAILARSGPGSAAGDGLAICKALQVVAFVAFDLPYAVSVLRQWSRNVILASGPC